jgi:carbon-monoxide dehydrogenase medium subunit
MYPPNIEYVRANSIGEALDLLGQHENARLLAGGHSLIPALKLRVADAGMFVDIGRIDGLKGISSTGGMASIGPLTTHADVARSGDVPAGLSEAAGTIGDPQVRNRGTVGGNIAHADPGSDLPTILTALGATVQLQSSTGTRSVPAAEFFTGLFETAKKDGELITSIDVPEEGPAQGSAYEKMANPASGYAMVGAAASVRLEHGACVSASVAVGGLTPSAKRAPSVEAVLTGKTLDAGTIAAAAKAVASDLGDDILGDIHASADYRRAMAEVLVRRALTKAAERAGA